MNAQPIVQALRPAGWKQRVLTRLRSFLYSVFARKITVRVILLSPVQAQAMGLRNHIRNTSDA